LGIVVALNGYLSLGNNYGLTLKERLDAVDKIINLTKNNNFNLVGKGPNSQFQSFTMNYEYLLWWKGHAPSNVNEKIKVVISEDKKGIRINPKN